MMGKNISLVSSVASHIKKVKLMLFLSLKLWKWRLKTDMSNVGRAYNRLQRWRSFNAGGPRGLLCGCFEEEEEDDGVESSSNYIRRLERTRSSYYGYNPEYDDIDDDHEDDEYDDVDRRAEIFITNFRSRLLMERQVSLNLRYREN